MPLYTQYYGLGIRKAGEPLSASLDQSRMTIIDNEMGFMADLIGDGLINGWGLSSPSLYTVRVDGGMGLIDRFTTRTFGPLDSVLSVDGMFYVYMLRKLNVVGGFSDYSPPISYLYTDHTPPAPITGLSLVVSDYNSISLTWTPNTEPDLDHYNVYRSLTNMDWSTNVVPVLAIPQSSVILAVDTGLSPSTIYYYRVTAVDETGNESEYVARTVSTTADTRVPAAVTGVTVYAGNEMLEPAWLASTDTFVTGYQATLQQRDVAGNPVGSPVTQTVDANTFYCIFSSLTNNQPYTITVYALNGAETSNGVVGAGVPAYNGGPDEVQTVTLGQSYDGQSVSLSISWTPAIAPPNRYVITLTENESVVSNPITVSGATTSTILVAYSMTNQGTVTTKPILENTNYSMRVQGETASGALNVGIVSTISIAKYSKPLPPTNVSVVLYDNQYLMISWTNPAGEFDHNLLTLTSTNQYGGGNPTTILNAVNVGRSQVYIENQKSVMTQTTYTVSVQSVDSSGNLSLPTTATLTEGVSLNVPQTPEFVVAGTQGYINVAWATDSIPNVAYYKVYRTPYTGFVNANAFTLLDTLGPEYSEFNDYSVVPNTYYAYVVSVTDTFGNESPGPGTGDPTDFLLCQASENDELLVPNNVTGAPGSNNSFVISWGSDTDFFDGYQIYRSVNDLHDWTLIGVTASNVYTFTDTDILLRGGVTYNYIIRKFRNEGDVVLTDTEVLPQHAIRLGTVNVSEGFVTTDTSDVVVIANLKTPVTVETQERIALHHHTYNSDTDDRRINLSTDWELDDWTSDNYITYITGTDLTEYGAAITTYTVYIDGVQTTMLYDLDVELGSLTFESALADPTSLVSVVFHDIDETQNLLPPRRLAGLNASHFTSGIFAPQQIPQIDHAGRIGEQLLPVLSALSSSDQVHYTNSSQPISAGVTFFDFCLTQTPNQLIAGVSSGIWTSDDLGVLWQPLLTTMFPVTRITCAPINQRYIALSGNVVYLASELLTDWTSYTGMQNVGITRSAVEDPDGYIYVATDLGVFVLSPNVMTPVWQLTPSPSYNSSNCFVVFYDDGLDAVVTSTELGVFFSTDYGAAWNLWAAFTDQTQVFDHLRDGPIVYLLAGPALYRKADDEATFVNVASFPQPAKKMQLFGGYLYVSTEGGVLTSEPVDQSSPSMSMTFASTLPQLSEGGKNYGITAMLAISDRILFGMDQRIYNSVTFGDVAQQYTQDSQTATVFVNGVERLLGVYYNSVWVTFDDRLSPNDVVQVASSYVNYMNPHGGWADVNYLASIVVYANGIQINDPTQTAFESEGPPTYGNIMVPTFTDRNSNVDTAQTYANTITALSATIDTNFTAANVATMVSTIEAFNSEVDASIAIVLPEITMNLMDLTNTTTVTAVVDAANGAFTFAQFPSLVITSPNRYWKYTQMTADVFGVTVLNTGQHTHDELDDLIELTLSGLSAGLAVVHQVNQVESGLYVEEQFPGLRANLSPPEQMSFATGCTTQWYDRFNSTVDYNLQIRNQPTNIALQYASCVLFVPSRNEVWAGGFGGVIAINVETLAITPVFVPPDGSFVTNMMLETGQVYIVTSTSLSIVNLYDLSVQADLGFGLPSGLNSIINIHNNYVVGSTSGAYMKQPTNVWEQVLAGNNVRVEYFGDLAFAMDDQNNIYSSQSGSGWTSKGAVSDTVSVDNTTVTVYLSVNNVVKDVALYWATTTGLFTDGATFYSKEIRLAPVNLTGTPNVNDIATDGTLLVAGASDGSYYSYVSGNFVQTTNTGLDTIHKVALVNGDIWLFGFDKLKVVSSGAVVKLATGNRLTWQI